MQFLVIKNTAMGVCLPGRALNLHHLNGRLRTHPRHLGSKPNREVACDDVNHDLDGKPQVRNHVKHIQFRILN